MFHICTSYLMLNALDQTKRIKFYYLIYKIERSLYTFKFVQVHRDDTKLMSKECQVGAVGVLFCKNVIV